MINVILCDDHALIRRGVADTLTENSDIKIIAEVENYQRLKNIIKLNQNNQIICNVLLLDINLPGRNGLEILAFIMDNYPDIKVLILSMYPEDQYALRCLKLGAFGYINKADNPINLIKAVRTLYSGKKYLTAEVSELLANNLLNKDNKNNEISNHNLLSERELHTLQKIANGERLIDIAEELMLSPKTISVYRSRVLQKLGLNNNAQLTTYALENNLINKSI